MAHFAITYEEFFARATERYGAEWAAAKCPTYARYLEREYRERARTEPHEDAGVLHRLADMIDPDGQEVAS